MDNKKSSTLVVTSPEAARTLLSQTQVRYLTPFMTETLTASEAAQRCHSSLNSMFVRIERFLGQGLLVVSGTRKGAGRNLTTYRAAAPAFYIPYDLMPFESFERLHEHLDSPLERKFRQHMIRARFTIHEGYGYQVYVNENGQMDYHPATAPGLRLSASKPDAPAVINLWADDLHLNFEDAKAFQQDLLRLYHHYRQRPGAQLYLLRIGLTPVRADN